MDLNLEGPSPQQLKQKLQTACILALVAAAGLLFAAVSKRWLAAEGVDVGLGPRGFSCGLGADDCDPWGESASNAEVVDKITQVYKSMGRSGDAPSGLFPIVGWITLLGCAISGGALIWAAVTAYKGGVPLKPIPPTTVALLALMVSLIAGMIFIATHPFRGKGFSALGVSTAFWVFGVCNVLGIVAAQMLAKFKQKDPNELVI